jgi:LysM repeat protein
VSGGSTTTSQTLVDYTVASGDSLWKIAHDHGTSVGKLKRINSLATDNLSIGQKLKVPQVASAQ